MDHIRKVVDLFPWEKELQNLDINDIIFYLTKRLKLLFLIIFLMKQLHLMIEILRGLTNSIETTSLSGRSTTLE